MTTSQNYECWTPKVIYSEKWGTAAKALVESANKTYLFAMIAPDSEAQGVELRPGGASDYRDRIIVTKDSPYFGPLVAKGLGVYPLIECPADATDLKYSHKMKLLLYPSAPGFYSNTRAELRKSYMVGSSGDSTANAFIFPIIPAFGRKKSYFTVSFDQLGTGDIDFVFEGGRIIPSDADERMAEHTKPSGASDTSIWNGGSGIKWATLKTESAVATDEDYHFQYEGDFDFFKVSTVDNTETAYTATLISVLKD